MTDEEMMAEINEELETLDEGVEVPVAEKPKRRRASRAKPKAEPANTQGGTAYLMETLLGEYKGQCVSNRLIVRENGKNKCAANRIDGEWHVTSEYEIKLGARKAAE